MPIILRLTLKNLVILLFTAFVSSFAGATNWVHVSTDTVAGKKKAYVDTDTVRAYDGYIADRNYLGFKTPSYYISAFVKFTPLEKPKKTITAQYVFNCKNHSSFPKSIVLELSNGQRERGDFNLIDSSQFESIFPDTMHDNVAEFVCKFQ